MLFDERDINYTYGRTLRSVDAGGEDRHLPPMPTGFAHEGEYELPPCHPAPARAEFVVQSGPAWADRWTDQGWVECDPQAMRHNRYETIWAVGDVAGVPKGKTAASVKFQVPVVEDHLVAAIRGARAPRPTTAIPPAR